MMSINRSAGSSDRLKSWHVLEHRSSVCLIYSILQTDKLDADSRTELNIDQVVYRAMV